MIATAHFEHFKRLRDVTLELGRLNVIVGRNGVGKSSALEGLHLLLQLATEKSGEDQAVLGRPGVLFRGPRAPERLASLPDPTGFAISVTTTDGMGFGLRATLAPEDVAPPYRFDLHYGPEAAPETLQLPCGASDNPRLFFSKPHAAKLGAVVVLKLRAADLAAPHYSDREEPRIEHTGEGLPSVLQYLSGVRDGTLEQIEEALRRVVPDVRGIRTKPAKIVREERVPVTIDGQTSWHEQRRTLTGAKFEVEFADLGWVPADQLSDGTLLTLGLVTLLQHRPPQLILLDDLDAGLHPMAQREVVEVLRSVLAARPELQIVATSHSPFVLDALDPTECFVAGPVDPHRPLHSHIRRLDQHPSWPGHAQFLGAGEFWSAVGEGWVAETAT